MNQVKIEEDKWCVCDDDWDLDHTEEHNPFLVIETDNETLYGASLEVHIHDSVEEDPDWSRTIVVHISYL